MVRRAHLRAPWFLVLLLVASGCLVAETRINRADDAGQRAAMLTAPDADSWFRLVRSYPTGREAPADLLARVTVPRPRPAARPALNLPGSSWVSIGPRPIWVQNSLPYGGRVTAVVPHPTSANTIYVGADTGGIWRTTDGGGTWQSLTDDLPVPSIQSMAIDPANPSLLYATTINRTYPTRLLRTVDGGATWAVSSIVTDRGQTLSPAPCSVNVFKACIPPSSGRLLIDPRRAGSANTSTIYYTGASHLLRSDDSGRTFHAVLTLATDLDFAGANAPNENPEVEYIRDAALDPSRPDLLYVAVAKPACVDSSCGTMTSAIVLYRSTDGGGHWVRQELSSLGVYSLANTRYADPGAVYVPRIRLAIAPSNPDTVALAFRDEQLGRPRVLLSTTTGAVWAETPAPTNTLTWPLGLVFSPTDAKTLYVGSNSVYRTTNSGQTWSILPGTHADNIVLTFTADGNLLVGNDGGIFRLSSSSAAFSALHIGLPITEFYSVAAHPTNALFLAGGTQDNGTVIYQGSVGWSLITGGDGGDVVFDPASTTTSTTLYAEIEWYFSGGSNVYLFIRCQLGSCIQRTSGIDLTLAGPFIPRMAMDPSSPSTIWITAEKLFRTDNRGDSWTAATPSVAAAQRCWQDAGKTSCANARYFTAAAVAPTSSQTVWAGTLNGDVWLTTNRGSTWQSVAGPNAGPLPVRAVNEIVVDPLDANTAYVSYSGFDASGSGRGHVFRTTDAGKTWVDLSGNLPDVPVNALLIDPDSVVGSTPRVLYAGTDVGVFRITLDGNGTWQSFGTGLPPVVVNRLAYNASTRQLIAATYGRGVWAISPRFSR